MSDSDWRSLNAQREALILGELGGLLHDWKKCMDWAVAGNWRRIPRLASKQAEWQQRSVSGARMVGSLSSLLSAIRVEAVPESLPIDLKVLADKGSDPSKAEADSNELVHLMGRCHDIAHVEKGFDSQTEQQQASSDRVSSAFGYEYCEPDNLLSRLESAIRQYLQQPAALVPSRSAWLLALRDVLAEAWGDTRRPANDVTLWDWSYAVASLYKSELARHFLEGGWRERQKLRWRLLRINFDVLGLYSRAIKLADLFGYARAVEKACEQTKRFVEDEYPLGNEVYRDTTGVYFIFPDLDPPEGLKEDIRHIVEGVEPELAPRIDVGPARGQGPEENLKRLLAASRQAAQNELSRPFGQDNLSPRWSEEWAKLDEGKWEVCPVCRLRPKREEATICCHCEERRKPRLKAWKENPDGTTIWFDELADANGRIALLVGKFSLDDWLSGDLVQTLLVRCDPASKSFAPKNPSPARLRRVWETCQGFWCKTVSAIFSDCVCERRRWELVPENASEVAVLPEDQVCDGKLNGKPASVFRIDDHLLTVSYFPENAPPQPGTLRVSWEGHEQRDSLELAIAKVCEPGGDTERFRTYRPTLTLLTSPDQFMALTPASAALDLAEKVKNAYAREFGKVQNRLPIFLGLVFFPRKIPLFAVMDTARRMLGQVDLKKEKEEVWEVSGIQENCVSFANGYSWCVPQKMGDGRPDDWYPYFFVEGDASTCRRAVNLAANQAFELLRQEYKNRWLVHVSELSQHPKVIVTPSRFSFLFLEHSAQRFEFDPKRHVMYLDDLSRFAAMWTGIRQTPQMTDTKLRNVAGLLQEKELWRYENPDVFRHLAETTLKTAGLWNTSGGPVTPDDVISRRFERCLEPLSSYP